MAAARIFSVTEAERTRNSIRGTTTDQLSFSNELGNILLRAVLFLATLSRLWTSCQCKEAIYYSMSLEEGRCLRRLSPLL